MLTAVDSSVLLDVLTDAPHADSSERELRKAASEGGLIISECVLAEIRTALANRTEVDEFLADWQLRFVPSSEESALLAGEIFAAYLRRRSKQGRIIADFLIGANARVNADSMLERARVYLLFYFPSLSLLVPK